MVDMDAAIGFVVAHGDNVDRARLSWLCSGTVPAQDILAKVEMGQAPSGGWPALWAGDVASVDATCFRLAELDDLDGLRRPAARAALAWLAQRQRPDGGWEEDSSLAGAAPEWARPGDPEARLYLTANAAFWLTVAGPPAPGGTGVASEADATAHAEILARACQVLRTALPGDGTWQSYLVTGWLAAAVLYRCGWYHESAQIQVALTDRVPGMSAADVALLGASLRRAGMSPQEWVVKAAIEQLTATQRGDGGWASDDGDAFDVHTTLAAIRAVLPDPQSPPPQSLQPQSQSLPAVSIVDSPVVPAARRVGRHAAPDPDEEP